MDLRLDPICIHESYFVKISIDNLIRHGFLIKNRKKYPIVALAQIAQDHEKFLIAKQDQYLLDSSVGYEQFVHTN